jgi:hypothetical protein
MTSEEKLFNSIREWLIEKDGSNFLKLSEKDQNNIILAVIQTHINELKSQK